MKQFNLARVMCDLYGNPFKGKGEFSPETFTDADGIVHPVIDADTGRQNMIPVVDPVTGRQKQLDLLMSDFLAKILCDVCDDLVDSTAIAWARELDEKGTVTLDESKSEVKWFEAFLSRQTGNRIVRWRLAQLWADASSEAVSIFNADVS